MGFVLVTGFIGLLQIVKSKGKDKVDPVLI
jgi:hypothetical protein